MNPESAMTTTRQKALLQRCQSYHWFFILLFLLILCLLFLVKSVTLGYLYHKCLNEASNQTGLNLPDKLEKLQPGEINRGQEFEFCPEEWRPWKGKCYFVSEEKKGWSSSMVDCVFRGSHLAVVKNSTDLVQRFIGLFSYFKGFISTKDRYWIGLNYVNNTWMWQDGTKSRSPEVRYNSTCAVLSGERLFDWNCDYRNHWICEKPAV
ncbi:killer cell lectin-like receptor subfamily B member 1 [Microcaecilia unicolor]|uniref:Killer cell lectin-like receptor subfamily B member 1 n=1 Tax=Microcaecilia unicolor TaxID=1415580 RepID=A0A6P7WWU4_9AMPH|nr:killer cell lectin-like receptor subfamily B member 1 [Microcaecilia unicolor]